ncbi:flagellar assembly protein FliW [Spirillospora albida]|uniref:flagellar assembly protein FliW n=1 Tax=Spirillospora albida TaxID=58123 RepID=UPI0004BF4DAE|nr:flagellar assembly protein FliW [Spirillospora albida]
MISLDERTTTATEEQGVDTAELPTIELVAPMPGFPQHRTFVLVRADEQGTLYSLRSLEDPGLRFLVIAPAPFFPEYAPEVDDDTLAELKATGPEHLLVLLIVTATGAIADATANLMAPIIVNTDTHRAAQVVLAGSDLPIRAPLVTA